MSIETLPLMKGEGAFAWFNKNSEITTMTPDVVSWAAAGSPAPGVLAPSGFGIVPLVTPRVVVLNQAPAGVTAKCLSSSLRRELLT